MKRFLYWRKMTWSFALWSAAIAAWMVSSFFVSGTDRAAACAADSAVRAGLQTTEDCVSGVAGGTQFASWGIPSILAVWLAGMAVLGLVWFVSRPLFSQGRGVSFRRYRATQPS